MARIESTLPNVAAGYQSLRIDGADIVQDHAYQQPDIPEDRLELRLTVVTEGEPQETWRQRVSLSLGEKSTLGSIYYAITGQRPGRDGIDTDEIVGKVFDTMVTHSDSGWPKLVAGSAARHRRTTTGTRIQQPQQQAWADDEEEAPF
jgi:hypothetical protein